MRRWVAAASFVLCVLPARAAAITGRVTESGTGAPIAGRTVSATRSSTVPAGGPSDSIPVEWDATTDSNGSYTLTIPAGTPGADRVFVYTRSTRHFNRLWEGPETSANTPWISDLAQPGVVEVNATASVPGIDFVLDPNRTDERVLMRDGVTRLATVIWRPGRQGRWPTILLRTPYDKEALNPDFWIRHEYAVVGQDVRGRYASDGVWKPFQDDGWGVHQDGYDTVEWVAAQSWSDGHVGTTGGSALAILQYMAAGSAPPHLDAAWASVGCPQLYRQFAFQGGSYRKELVDSWLDGQGGSYMKDEYKQHPNEDEYWLSQDLFTRLSYVKVPMYHVGGWFDLFDDGTLLAFSRLQHEAALGAKWNQKLRMGPWTHFTMGLNLSGEAYYPPNALDGDAQNADSVRWFDFWLKGKDTGIMDESPVRTYVMGPQGVQQTQTGNFWRLSADWPPPANRTKYYLARRGGLSTSLPGSNGGSDSFSYDPLNPVPTVGGPNFSVDAGPYDQTAVEARADVLVYTTDVLDGPVEVSGNIRAHLFASSSATDTDWTVKLVDVYPNGKTLSVMDGVLRARHRPGFDTEQLLVPGQIQEFEVDAWSTSLIFGTGHQIRVEVSSSNDPRFDPNPNTGEPFRMQTHTEVAQNTIYHDAAHPSSIELPIVDTATAGGCATTSRVTGFVLDKVDAEQVRFHWDAVGGADPCFGEYRLYGADDPSSWAWFVRHPLERTTETEITIPAPYTYYLVIAGGTDGANGRHAPLP